MKNIDIHNSAQEVGLGIKTMATDVPFDPTGYVELNLINNDTGEVTHIESHNQITYLGRHRMSRVISGDSGVSATQKVISVIKVATGGCPAGSPFDPITPAVNDVGLYETVPANIKTFTSLTVTRNEVANNTAPWVTWTKIITCSEVDELVNEMGLFFADGGPMWSHYTFATVDLRSTSNNSLEIIWKTTY